MPEEFSQARMNRCIRIQQVILEHWQQTRTLEYVVRATESVAGLSLADLRLQYFSVGISSDLTDLPFTDLLVVFSMIAQTAAAMRAKVANNDKTGSFRFSITTDFTDVDALKLLSQIKIETPFDSSEFLKLDVET